MLKCSRCDIMPLQTTIMNTRFGSSKETKFSKEHHFYLFTTECVLAVVS